MAGATVGALLSRGRCTPNVIHRTALHLTRVVSSPVSEHIGVRAIRWCIRFDFRPPAYAHRHYGYDDAGESPPHRVAMERVEWRGVGVAWGVRVGSRVSSRRPLDRSGDTRTVDSCTHTLTGRTTKAVTYSSPYELQQSSTWSGERVG
jgi:hypothetical protein